MSKTINSGILGTDRGNIFDMLDEILKNRCIYSHLNECNSLYNSWMINNIKHTSWIKL